MPRRPPILPLVLLVLGAAACSPPARSNLLLLSVDTLRADHLGAYGYGRATSPELDAFARGAVVFDEARAHSSWTLASLASMMTSRHPSTHGCRSFKSALDPSFPTLAEVLRDAGYDTGLIASHAFLGRRHGLHQGFVHLDDELVSRDVSALDAITSDAVSDKALAWLRHKGARRDDHPWFLWVHYFDPHETYRPHPGTIEPFGEEPSDLYDGEIAYTDRHLGRVLRALDEEGLAEDTVVVLLSDHGEELEDRGEIGHGHTLHRELLHVPLVIRAPGFEPRRVPHAVRGVDLLPTLLELLGVELPGALADVEGVSLVDAMRGGDPGELPVLAELRLYPVREADSLELGPWKLIVEPGSRRAVLYDRRTDPGERTDVAARHPALVEELREALERMLARSREAAARFSLSEEVALTSTDLDVLRALGYLGDG